VDWKIQTQNRHNLGEDETETLMKLLAFKRLCERKSKMPSLAKELHTSYVPKNFRANA